MPLSVRIFLSILLLFVLAGGLVPTSPALAEQGLSPQPFILALHLDTLSGPPVAGVVSDGRSLVGQAFLPLLGDAGQAVLGNLIWQVYDRHGGAVAGYTKMRQKVEVGGQEFVFFDFSTRKLANGTYYLGLTHQNATRPDLAFQAVKAFEVQQPVAIADLLVDESAHGRRHRPVLYEDQAPHIFVSYHLAPDVDSVLVQLDVFDSRGKLLATRSAVRDRDPLRPVHRFGIRLPPGVIAAGEKGRVTALLTTPDGARVMDEVEVEVVGLALQVDMPDVLRSGEVTAFQVRVPDTFSPPSTLTLSPRAGISLHYEEGPPGLMAVWLSLAPAVETGQQYLDLKVTDQDGRIATATVDVRVEAGPASARPGSKAGSFDQQGGIGSSAPPL